MQQQTTATVDDSAGVGTVLASVVVLASAVLGVGTGGAHGGRCRGRCRRLVRCVLGRAAEEQTREERARVEVVDEACRCRRRHGRRRR